MNKKMYTFEGLTDYCKGKTVCETIDYLIDDIISTTSTIQYITDDGEKFSDDKAYFLICEGYNNEVFNFGIFHINQEVTDVILTIKK